MSALPEGKTCSDCAHVESCLLVGNASRQNMACSFDPPMFLAVERGSSLAVRRQQEALTQVDRVLEMMVASGLAVVKDGKISLTPSGQTYATEVCAANPELEGRARRALQRIGPTPEECTPCSRCGGYTTVDDGALVCVAKCADISMP